MLTGRCQIIAECASNHGGNLSNIASMIQVAAENGADMVKFQAYQTKFLNPADPQYVWLTQAELSDPMVTFILEQSRLHAIVPMFSVFTDSRVGELYTLGVRSFKIGHANRLPTSRPQKSRWYQSFAWGRGEMVKDVTSLSVIPLYPAPISALAGIRQGRTSGYSDHSIGLEACQIMLARGATVIEKHFSINGCPRRQDWDMDEHGLATLRKWADTCTTATLGTDQTQRWMHGQN